MKSPIHRQRSASLAAEPPAAASAAAIGGGGGGGGSAPDFLQTGRLSRTIEVPYYERLRRELPFAATTVGSLFQKKHGVRIYDIGTRIEWVEWAGWAVARASTPVSSWSDSVFAASSVFVLHLVCTRSLRISQKK